MPSVVASVAVFGASVAADASTVVADDDPVEAVVAVVSLVLGASVDSLILGASVAIEDVVVLVVAG